MSLPVGIYNYLITRVLGTLSKVCGSLAAGFCSMVGCSIMTGAFITHRMLSSTFLAMDKMVLHIMAGAFCTNSSSYSIACLVLLPTSLSVRLVIAKIS